VTLRGRGEARRRSRARGLGLPLLSAAVLAAGGCGGGERTLTVSAASSLKTAFTEQAERFGGADVRLSFGGSDQLAAQIRAGARPDVFAAANTELPRELHAEGLVEEPVRFASNRLVVAVRRGGGVKTVAALSEPGTRIAIGSPSVPVGAYTREALARMPDVRSNVASEEPDVSSIVARVRAGAVDAGFVYATDVRAVEELRALELPFRTRVEYAAAVVRGTDRAAQARAFVRGLRGAEALREAGFGP
jgi:molybdate transport system substrate-binding protein